MTIRKGDVVTNDKKVGIVEKINDDGTYDLRIFSTMLLKHYTLSNVTERDIKKVNYSE